jgi:UDP-N-acetylmuramoyl-tripeptide--D-alanyl-D-alanine ligase
MLVHIRETRQGRSILFGFEPLAKLAIIALYIVSIFYSSTYIAIPFTVFGIYAYEFVRFGIDLIQKKVNYPVFTPKLLSIAALVLLLVFGMLMVPLLDKFFWLVFADKFVLFFVALFMGLFSFPSMFYKDTQINKAITKIRKHKDTTIIGITGSYGKGSTKEYMAHILSEKFNTLKTPSTHNTPIGIARTVLNKLNKSTQIFVVEMGAYHLGDIAEMCDMVCPVIGVLTAVNDQHVSLFGSIENTKKTKYELIESLPSNGLALFNGNNVNTVELFKNTRKKKKYLYYVGETNQDNAYIWAHSIKVHPTFLTFDVTIGKEVYHKLHVNLVGPHHIQNLLPGIFIGQQLGMNKQEIAAALKQIKPLYKTMQPYVSSKGVMLIDDTYNANPASVLSAVEYLSHQRGKKGLVLQPMIELGKQAKEDHYLVAKEIGKVCKYLYLTNKNFNNAITRGIKDSGGKCIVVIDSPKSLADKVKSTFRKNETIVFEGKEANSVLDLIDKGEVKE